MVAVPAEVKKIESPYYLLYLHNYKLRLTIRYARFTLRFALTLSEQRQSMRIEGLKIAKVANVYCHLNIVQCARFSD